MRSIFKTYVLCMFALVSSFGAGLHIASEEISNAKKHKE